MKTLTLLSCSFFLSNAFAVHFEIRAKGQTSVFTKEIDVSLPQNLGAISVAILNEAEIPYDGSESGIKSMLDLGNDIVFITPTEMKAYGWCFAINGEVPETMSDHTVVETQDSTIVWFYAYAHFKDGAWIKQCAPDQDFGTK